MSVTHLENFVCGDSKARIPRLFSSRSLLLGTEGAFAELIIHDKDTFMQLMKRYMSSHYNSESYV